MSTPSPLPFPGLYPSKDALATAFQVVRKAKVPQIPDIVLALKRELGRPDPDLRMIAELVAKDLVITGRLLKTINSPAFNPRTKIGSVQQAIALLGMTRLVTLVTAEAINQLLESTAGSVRVIWESILEEAQATTAIASLIKTVSPDEAYLFGIMHDVGCLLFGNLSVAYGTEWILRSNASPKSLLDYERTMLGVDHQTVGFLLAGHWQLPDSLALAIYHHHDHGYIEGEDHKVRTLIAMLKLAHYLVALSHGTHELPEMEAYRNDAWQELALTESDWSGLCRQAQEGAWNP